MSKADIAEKVEAFRKQTMNDFIATHGVTVGRAMEAFTKTSAMIRATQGLVEKANMSAADSRQLIEILNAYIEYTLGQYFTVINLTQEQADLASDASYKMLKDIFDMFAANSDDAEKKGSSQAGKPGIQVMH